MDNKEQLFDGVPAEDMDNRDLIEGVDEDGNEILLEVIRYFFYNGEEYVVLGEAHEDDCGCDCEHCHEHCEDEEDEGVFIMKVVAAEEDGEEIETFVPVEDEELLDKLIDVVEADFEADEEIDDWATTE